MDRKSLFDLPRELLIEIILNVKKKHDKETAELMRRCFNAHAYKCDYIGCQNFQVKNNYSERIFSFQEDDIKSCDLCRKNYCDGHNIIIYFACCGIRQCNSHNQCEVCEISMCLGCEAWRKRCKNC
jgi:hypothetical protein